MTTYRIGPMRERKNLNAVLPLLQSGDVVEVDPGVYRETVRFTRSGRRDAPITVRGVGATRAVFDGQNLDMSGKGPVPRAVLQIEGAYLILEHLEIKNARNGENAAGVRLLHATQTVIRDCKISYCDMGIFGDDRETALIENCEVCFNGTRTFNGYSHNFYMQGNRVVVRGCYIHDALYGQNYKSRAHYNELWFNRILDSNEGEVGCVDERGATDRPNSNTLLVGNLLSSRRDRTGNTAKFLLFGTESGAGHDGTLFLYRNTFIAGDASIVFLTLSDPKARAVLCDNRFQGSDRILHLAKPAALVTANHNQLPKSAAVPPGWADKPVDPLRYIDGDGTPHILTRDAR